MGLCGGGHVSQKKENEEERTQATSATPRTRGKAVTSRLPGVGLTTSGKIDSFAKIAHGCVCQYGRRSQPGWT